jgi:HK97 gp10 family phage protein
MARQLATLEGGDELVKELLRTAENAKKSVKGINRAGTNVIKKEAKANARALTTRSGGVVKATVRLRSGFVVGSVVPAKGFGFLKFFEYGTKPGWRWARRKGPFTFYAGNKLIVTRLIKHTGMEKQPWLAPAIESAADQAIAVIGEKLRDAIERNKVTPEGSDG